MLALLLVAWRLTNPVPVAFLKTLEEKTKVPKLYIFAAAAAVVFFLLFANIFAGILSDIIALMYPAYASFKALESPGHDDDKKWYARSRSHSLCGAPC